jgi:hypothetical protein
VREGHYAEGQREGERVAPTLRQAEELEERHHEQPVHDGLRKGAQAQRGDSDAELADGEVLVQLPASVPDHARRRPALLDEPVDLGGADPDEGELGRHEEPVQGHEQERDEEPEQGNG